MQILKSKIPFRNHLTQNKDLLLNPVDAVQKRDYKPEGFWYSLKDEWINWCEGEQFYGDGVTGSEIYTIKNRYLFEVSINEMVFTDLENKDKNKILVLSNSDDLKKFTDQYMMKNMDINWKKVVEDYGGIEIRNYRDLWKYRFIYMWFYGWDVSSGCLWRKSIIRQTDLISLF
jgi:hypothetical protein